MTPLRIPDLDDLLRPKGDDLESYYHGWKRREALLRFLRAVFWISLGFWGTFALLALARALRAGGAA